MWRWATLALLLVSGTNTFGQTVPATTASAAPASAPAPDPWDCRASAVVAWSFAAGGTSLWCTAYGVIWRYDVLTGKSQTFTVLDGLPLDMFTAESLVAAPDDSCAARIGDDLYLYRNARWVRLPRPLRPAAARLAFDAFSRLHLAVDDRKTWHFFEWQNDRWLATAQADLPRMPPLRGGFAVLPNGYFAQTQQNNKNASYYVDCAGAARAYDPAPPWAQRFYRVGGKLIAEGLAAGGDRAYYSLTPDGVKTEFTGWGIDLAGKGYLKRTTLKEPPWIGITCTGDDTPMTRGIDIRVQAEYWARDAKGRIWVGPNCWDGNAWSLILPPTHLPEHWRLAGAVDDLVRFDWDKLAWSATPLPAEARDYDAATQTAWVIRLDAKQWTLQRLAPKEETLLTVPAPAFEGYPQWRDPTGSWWWTGRATAKGQPANRSILQLDAQGKLHTYPIPADENRAGPDVFLSPTGSVWRRIKTAYARYDPAQDQFIPQEPWQDFGFDFGTWHLAGLPGPAGNRMFRRQANGTWADLRNPFGGGVMECHPWAFRGDRMLVTAAALGVLEYDASHDAWALLTDNSGCAAYFDPRGRRTLVHAHCVLRYTGDPVEAQHKELGPLLNLMDDPAWQVREEATQKLKEKYPLLADRLRAVADDTRFSPEVRTRIAQLLAQSPNQQVKLTGLLRTMHPLVEQIAPTGPASRPTPTSQP